MTFEGYKILVVAPAWVGDAVMSLALIHRLKQQNPQAEITVLVVPWCVAVFSLCEDVTHVIPLNIPHGVLGIKARWQCAQMLKASHFDIAYVLPNSWKSALVPFLARIPKRIGFVGEMRWGLLTECHQKSQDLPLLVDKYQSLARGDEPFLRPKLTIKSEKFDQDILLKKQDVTLAKPVIAFCPGAEYGPAKRWPSHYYVAVAKHFIHQGWQVWVFGSPKDAAVAKEITTAVSGDIVSWVGHTTLTEAIYLLRLAQKVVTNDSGLMHVAAALDLPTAALFGSSSPSYTPPLSDKAIVKYLHVSCSPCFKRECSLTGDNYMKCLTGIPPETVIADLEHVLI